MEQKMKIRSLKIGLITALALVGAEVSADPCGMVPPIHVDRHDPGIARVGAQRTYVMFKDGMETMALRPGFEGSVEEFGMLIPFPTPPAIRKIDDDTFAQIEAAVDPPELQVDIRDPQPVYRTRNVPSMAFDEGVVDSVSERGLAYDEVRVINQEAVGMYQVAVLAAGSPKALAAWMTENGFRYPDGMDAVVAEYVADGWVFLAVKAKVGSAKGVSPRPGMRHADSSLPAGATFDGHVQGMGFRFKTEEPVLPMRLSVFNGEGPRNVIYMLTDEGVALRGAPKELVVRQVSGRDVFGNLTNPIPVNVTGGKLSDLRENEQQSVASRRDPEQYNGIARDIFAADLLAVRQDTLSLHFEEEEKALLNISESLNLRGDVIDDLLHETLEAQRDAAVEESLVDLRGMTLTVLDGVIPGKLLAEENLRFEAWTMYWAGQKKRTDSIRPVAGGMVFWR
jgi:hypothetical protein